MMMTKLFLLQYAPSSCGGALRSPQPSQGRYTKYSELRLKQKGLSRALKVFSASHHKGYYYSDLQYPSRSPACVTIPLYGTSQAIWLVYLFHPQESLACSTTKLGTESPVVLHTIEGGLHHPNKQIC